MDDREILRRMARPTKGVIKRPGKRPGTMEQVEFTLQPSAEQKQAIAQAVIALGAYERLLTLVEVWREQADHRQEISAQVLRDCADELAQALAGNRH